MTSIFKFAGLALIFSIVSGLIIPCQADNINIYGNVTPSSGKEDANFVYSAVIKFPGGSIKNPDINEALIIELIISDNKVRKTFTDAGKFQGNGLSPDELIRGESNPFTFGPYSLGQLGLMNIDELSYEFVLTTGSGKELARNTYPGPKISIPPEFQSIQYSKTPVYYFLEYPITLAFNDKPSVIPSLQLYFRGPLNSSEDMSWTEDLSRTSAGTTHTFSRAIDLTKFRNGGNFSFNFTYDDSRSREGYAPITGGPYYFTILPYSPKIMEPIGLAKQIEYNNFSLRVSVEDEGMVLMGDPVGSNASLIINHPVIGEIIFDNLKPRPQGKYLVFEWDKSSVLFNKSDVLQSKKKPFQAHLRYWNEDRKYGANSSNYSFVLVNVTPSLTETHEPILYTSGDETVPQKIRAYVTYAKGMGDLKITATGPDNVYESVSKGSPAGVNKYEYDWTLPFNRSQAGNYTLSFTYIHDSLEGGSYEFERKPEYSFAVVPIFIEFRNGNVSLPSGMWNSSYSYTVEVNSSVEAQAILEIFSPCSSEWTDAGGVRKIKTGTSNISWTVQPFAYDCNELNSGKYRFSANFRGKDFSSTRVYEGPEIINDEVQLLSLEYSSPVYVLIGSQSVQTIRATAKSPLGSGQVRLGISGPDMNFNETISGIALGDDRYQYEWMVTFNDSHVDHNYNLSVGYLHPYLVAERPLGERSVQVKPVQISFGKAEFSPEKGRWNDTYIYSVPLNSSVETEVKLEVFDPCSHEWVQRTSGKAMAGQNTFNLTAKPPEKRCADAEGANASYRFIADFDGESTKSDVYSGPFINVSGQEIGAATEESGDSSSSSRYENGTGLSDNGATNGTRGSISVRGNVSPSIGFIQEWDEKDSLYELTYTLQLEKRTSQEMPWVQLVVKPYGPGSSWKTVGEKQKYDPSLGKVTWKIKPFWNTPFLGEAEYKFLVDNAESQPFEGPNIVARYKAADSWSGYTHKFNATITASVNLTVCLLSGDNRLPENIKAWRQNGDCKRYVAGSGEQNLTWKLPNSRPLYYDFDIQLENGEGTQ